VNHVNHTTTTLVQSSQAHLFTWVKAEPKQNFVYVELTKRHDKKPGHSLAMIHRTEGLCPEYKDLRYENLSTQGARLISSSNDHRRRRLLIIAIAVESRTLRTKPGPPYNKTPTRAVLPKFPNIP
jgi:hypothetical protein